MPLDLRKIEDSLCRSFCAEIHLHPRAGESRVMVETPFSFDDGDAYSLFMEPSPSGGIRITDCGHTLMHLSYSLDIDKIREGTRGRLFERVLADGGLEDKDGELVLESSMDQLGANVFRFGQTLTRIHDLTFLNRLRVESTFYEDLRAAIARLVPEDKMRQDYVLPNRSGAASYPIDYYIETPGDPLFLFGIPNKEKAMLTTIIVEHWLRESVPFDSMLVFQDQELIPRADLARLSNAGGEMVSTLDAREDLERKLRKRVGAPRPVTA
jgi:hypothetical protein